MFLNALRKEVLNWLKHKPLVSLTEKNLQMWKQEGKSTMHMVIIAIHQIIAYALELKLYRANSTDFLHSLKNFFLCYRQMYK